METQKHEQVSDKHWAVGIVKQRHKGLDIECYYKPGNKNIMRCKLSKGDDFRWEQYRI